MFEVTPPGAAAISIIQVEVAKQKQLLKRLLVEKLIG
jgi:hypothetical protein